MRHEWNDRFIKMTDNTCNQITDVYTILYLSRQEDLKNKLIKAALRFKHFIFLYSISHVIFAFPNISEIYKNPR